MEDNKYPLLIPVGALASFLTDKKYIDGPYSVMQSDWNSFCGNVVLERFYKASGDEDNILYQLYKSKYARTIIGNTFILYNIIRKCILTQQ